mmetsp:Transcript_73346/g.198325  ORF Transcript_73346/g.198325 Transcript_73346/m.198325 type:complete len:116 (+) Transcript_73346:483-830(+)
MLWCQPPVGNRHGVGDELSADHILDSHVSLDQNVPFAEDLVRGKMPPNMLDFSDWKKPKLHDVGHMLTVVLHVSGGHHDRPTSGAEHATSDEIGNYTDTDGEGNPTDDYDHMKRN